MPRTIDEQDSLIEKWHVSNIIRNKITGKPYMLVQFNKRVSAIIVDLESKDSLPPALTLLARDFGDFALDEQMEKKIDHWVYNYVAI